MKTHAFLEPLESRIAPAALINPTTLTYTDVDGDLVTVRISKGAFTDPGSLVNGDDDFTFTPAGVGQRLRILDLSNDGGEFKGTNVSITAVRGPLGGDGHADIGWINSAGNDLGAVLVDGDLAKLSAGDTLLGAGIKSLTVASLGVHAITSGVADLDTVIVGGAGKITVLGDVRGASIDVRGAIVGGTANVGAVKIGGSLVGGSAADSGSIHVDGKVRTLIIGHDLTGGAGAGSGRVQIDGDVAGFRLGGSVFGGAGSDSGIVALGGTVGALRIGGSILGGTAVSSGQVEIDRSVGVVKIGGSLLGTTTKTGRLVIHDTARSINIGGSVIGSTESGNANGVVIVDRDLGFLKIGGDLRSTGGETGEIIAGRDVKTVIIGGSVTHGTGGSAMACAGSVGTIRIGGDLRGDGGVAFICIQGKLNPASDAEAVALKSLRVGGTVSNAMILAGYTTLQQPINPDAQIGSITARDWIASSVVAGVRSNGDGFGNANDTAIDGGTDVISKISRIVITGSASGSGLLGQHFGFVAQQIGSVKVGGAVLPLTAGAANDNLNATDTHFTLGSTNDFRVREVAL